jgi:large subunit ribosomal protein L22
MESRAVARTIRIAPRKVRLVVDLVRGKKVEQALNILQFTQKRGAKIVSELIRSAVANADVKGKIDVDTLFVKKITITVDAGSTLKRFRPMPMGRAGKVRKRTSHITVVLEEA